MADDIGGAIIIDFVSSKNPVILVDTWYDVYHTPRVGDYVQIRDIEHRVIKITWMNRTFVQIEVQQSTLKD